MNASWVSVWKGCGSSNEGKLVVSVGKVPGSRHSKKRWLEYVLEEPIVVCSEAETLTCLCSQQTMTPHQVVSNSNQGGGTLDGRDCPWMPEPSSVEADHCSFNYSTLLSMEPQ